jgi:hypothetical protein
MRLISAVLCCSMSLAFAQSSAEDPIDTTVCEILKDPMRFHRKNVRVRAVSGTGIDVSPALYDHNCSEWIFLRLPTAGSIVNDWNYRTMEANLSHWFNPTLTATFEGRIEYQLMISEPNEMYLTVAKVSDVVVAPSRPAPKRIRTR